LPAPYAGLLSVTLVNVEKVRSQFLSLRQIVRKSQANRIYGYFYPHIDPLRTAPYGGYSTTRGERLNDCSFWRWLRTVLRLGNFTSEIRCERCPASMTGEIIGRGCYRPGINEAHREASALRSKTSRAPCLTVQLFVVFRIIVSDS
jgi:hypothetical protein